MAYIFATRTFHQNLFLVKLVTVAQRFRSSKCARLCAPDKRPHVSEFFEPSIFVMPQPVAFTRTYFLVELVIVAQRSRPSKGAQLSAPEKGATASNFFEPGIFVMPQPVAFTRTCFWWN